MTIYRPELVSGDKIAMQVTHPRHLVNARASYAASGEALSALGNRIGADMVTRSGTFEDAMLRALDKVSGDQQFVSNLERQAVTDPESVDIHDITIAQAKAAMSLNIARTVLNRVVQGWRDLINTR
ncbi:MAG: flagellar hook-basal body complex protein FliE [Treponema sp.]|jgi:flagellar hook-basal body complex protein FliE|nr:flagellar hook-basal body complex protein FliE [Treponema sp.]